ncbi:cuticle protein 10.9-like [Ornithodoros turicata]|uniref:cuticle protein 10.9-like n=1 Tax=Ornithodoros turicata TaxID=34597 RepID=UPI003139C803
MIKITLVLLVCVCFVAAQRFPSQGRPPVQESYPPIPYSFSYTSTDQEGTHTREESGDGAGRVNGKYTLQLADGRVRTVTYVSDELGHRQQIVTNELGTESQNPADVIIQSSAPTGAQAAYAHEPSRPGGGFRG